MDPQLRPFSCTNAEMGGYGNLAEHGRTNGPALTPPEQKKMAEADCAWIWVIKDAAGQLHSGKM